MKEKDLKRGFTMFVKSEKRGECTCCKKDVFNDQLYVEDNDKLYHYSCYNTKVDDK